LQARNKGRPFSREKVLTRLLWIEGNMLFQYVGSFQDRRYVFRVGDQRAAVWREVERVGTIESLNRAAARTGADSKAAMLGSLRIRQAVELQRAAANTSQLTRPLLLYYSCLNLIRGMLSVQSGGMGKPRHGAAFKSAGSLLDCGAKLDKDGEGTIPRLVQLYGGNSKDLAGLEVSLQDCLAEIPELKRDFTLIPGSVSNVAWVDLSADSYTKLLGRGVCHQLAEFLAVDGG
jgi:hypothetical protein